MIPLMIGGAVILHCIFLVTVLLRMSTKLSNKLLGGILFLLAVRMGGCIAGLMIPAYELVGLYLGAIAFSLAGPFIYAYLQSLWSPSFQLQSRHYYHLLPATALLVSLPLLTVEWVFGGYLLSLLSMMIYTIAAYIRLGKTRSDKRSDTFRWTWTSYFGIGMVTLLILFVSQSFFFDSFTYQGIIVASAIVLYFLTLVAVKQVKLFMYEPRKKNRHHQIEELGKRIEVALKKEEVYTNPLMNVTMLAKQLMVPPYLVSLAVNTYFEKSFPEIINALRIQKAEQLLIDPDKSHCTIESIAYESGFSALSAFYTSFKKTHRKTPRTYRKQSLKVRTKEVSPESN